MDKAHLPITESKLLLLYILESVGTLSNIELQRFCAQSAPIDYMELQLLLHELVQASLIDILPALGTSYQLTAKGAEALCLFKERIAYSRRERVDQASAQWKETIEIERQSEAHITAAPDGNFYVHMHLKSEELPYCDITVCVPSRKQAWAIQGNWKRKAIDLYALILTELSADSSQA
jgi:DNA-binding PadR family transcriptional regulator